MWKQLILMWTETIQLHQAEMWSTLNYWHWVRSRFYSQSADIYESGDRWRTKRPHYLNSRLRRVNCLMLKGWRVVRHQPAVVRFLSEVNDRVSLLSVCSSFLPQCSLACLPVCHTSWLILPRPLTWKITVETDDLNLGVSITSPLYV